MKSNETYTNGIARLSSVASVFFLVGLNINVRFRNTYFDFLKSQRPTTVFIFL